MQERIFNETEIPYNKFMLYGLDQEMVDDLPQFAMELLLSGRWTPSITTKIDLRDGNGSFKIPVRFQMVRTEEGTDLMVCPKKQTADLENFTEEEQNSLRNGIAILQYVPELGNCYAQLDEKTNKVAYSPSYIIEENLKTIYNKFGIPEEAQPQEVGERVTTDKNNLGITITYGVDLFADNCIRLVYGNEQKWEEEKQTEMPKYNFGIFGCWETNNENELTSYIKEKEYTQEMKEEFERVGDKNVERARGLIL